MNRAECATALKQSVAKVRKYDELLADEIFNELADYAQAVREEGKK